MLRTAVNRAARQAFTQQRRAGGSALNGNATSPHYADFGYGANQMLPFHELQKNPIRFRGYPEQVKFNNTPIPPGTAEQHPEFTFSTGHDFSIVPGINHLEERSLQQQKVQTRLFAGLYATIFTCLLSYERFMWDGFQFAQQPIWDEAVEVNMRLQAHALQWELPFTEMLKEDYPMSEVYKIIENRPFYTKNPYRFNKTDLAIADKNISYRAFEPALQKLAPEEYRTRANYIMFYTELQEKIAQISREGSPLKLEEELSTWLFTQNKYSVQELKEILEVAPLYNNNFQFHKNAVFDKESNEIVYFPGRHWAVAEENLKQVVPSMADNAGAKASVALVEAEPLLLALLKQGPAATLRNTFVYPVDENDTKQEQRAALWNLIVYEPENDQQKAQVDRLVNLQKATLTTKGDLSAFKDAAQASGLPIPNGFSVSAINYAVAKANAV